MATQALDLWDLVRKRPEIDPNDLADAVVDEVGRGELDYRTRLLIRDSVNALLEHWGEGRLATCLAECPAGHQIRSVCDESFDEIGFPSLRKRLMKKTDPEEVRQFLEHLGRNLHQPLKVYVGGSIALIIPGYITRHTEDIDIVGEVPSEIRNQHKLLEDMERLYGLHVGHVQTHYFPKGWQDRAHSQAPFGRLQVLLLDVYDVFLSKLFSRRVKDMGDLRVLLPQLDKERLTRKLKDDAAGFLAVPELAQIAQDNWQILLGEPLPQ